VVSLIVARARNGVIGSDGGLPWHLPTDLRRFRELTTGHAVLMGRRTYESLPDRFRPLPGRRNLVITRDPAWEPAEPGAEVFGSLEAALDACGRDCFVIGGAEVYAQAAPVADRVLLTEVDAEPEGDVVLPDLPAAEWRVAEAGEPLTENGLGFRFVTLARRPPGPLYHLPAARVADQRAHMEALEAAGVCIFCPEHVAEQHEAPVEHRGEHWYVTRNDFPYEGTEAHFLIVPHRHVRTFDELPDAAGAELWAIRRELKRRLAPLATATVERSGRMDLSGASIAHLHVHFVALPERPATTVRFKVSAEAS
jgi:dihydrofolate reductase/diadenosine tetraphosphate (Ap4A) HIT family hydrolase